MLQLAEKAKKELSQTEEEITGDISIGCGELLSVQELGKMMSVFQQRHPLVTFHLHSSYNQNIQEWLERGILDLGLMIEPVDVSKYNFVRMQQKEAWGALVKKTSSLAQKKVMTAEDLAGIPLITTRNPKVDNEIVSWFGNHAGQRKVVITYNLLYNGAMMAQQGIGTAMCLKLNCHYPGLKFVPLEPS